MNYAMGLHMLERREKLLSICSNCLNLNANTSAELPQNLTKIHVPAKLHCGATVTKAKRMGSGDIHRFENETQMTLVLEVLQKTNDVHLVIRVIVLERVCDLDFLLSSPIHHII